MTITKQTNITSVTLSRNGYIEYYEQTVFTENGERVGDTHQMHMVEPDGDVPHNVEVFIQAAMKRPQPES